MNLITRLSVFCSQEDDNDEEAVSSNDEELQTIQRILGARILESRVTTMMGTSGVKV